MKIRVVLAVEVDEDEWAAESEIIASSDWKNNVRNDVKEWVKKTLEEPQTIGFKGVTVL